MKLHTISLISIIAVSLCSGAAARAASGTFPAEPFNGLQITYSVSGAQITKTQDKGGFTTTRTLHGRLGSGTLRLSGSVKALNGYNADVSIAVFAGSKKERQTFRLERGQSRSFSVEVPIGATAANGKFYVHLTGNYRAGSRGLWVNGYLSMPEPAAAPDKKPPRSELSSSAALARLMQIYQRRIPRGIVGSGFVNNSLSFFSSRYSEYACGGYQAKVLALLDALRTSKDPQERALLEHFDYGPIQAYGRGHQAVVIYPKGSNWVESGIVLDPWPTQSPKRFAMAEWAQRFSMGTYHGIGPSSAYAQTKEYPTSGGAYQDPRDARKLTAAEQRWFRSLPAKKQAWLKRQQGDVFKKLIHYGYSRRELDSRIVVQCPLNAYLVDRAGRRSGYPGGRPAQGIPGVHFVRVRKSGDSFWTEFSFPRRADLRLVLEGTGGGSAMVLASDQMDRPSHERDVKRYSFRVQRGGRYQVRGVGEPLTSTAGQVAAASATARDVTSPPPPQALASTSASASTSTSASASTSTSTSARAPVRHIPRGKAVTLAEINNIHGVQNGPPRPTTVVLSRPARLTLVQTYHWNSRRGRRPGTVELVSDDGWAYGPFQCHGAPGQGGVPNAYWRCPADVELPAGSYRIQDSHPASWAHNRQSGGRGFVLLEGHWLR